MREQAYWQRKLANSAMLGFCGAAAGLAMLIPVLILGYTLAHGLAYMNLDFLTQPAKPVGELGGGMRNEIIGTLILVTVASIIAMPVGLMAGMFLSEFGGPRLTSVVRFAADILAGVPSIVVGVFAYTILVRPLRSYSAISAAVALAVIMIPILARTVEESLRLVPYSMREAALALGVTRWRAVVSVVMPGAITGIATGAMLAVARIAGETAPLIFTALGNNFGFQGLLKPIGALPLQIWKYAMSPYKDWQQQAWAGAFLLVVIVFITSLFVRWLTSRRHA